MKNTLFFPSLSCVIASVQLLTDTAFLFVLNTLMPLYVITGCCVRVEKGFYYISIHKYFYYNAGCWTFSV